MENPTDVILGGNKASDAANATMCIETPYAGSIHGSAQIQIKNGVEFAHRLSYRLFYGAIPAGCEIDHVCSNRRCINPFHLEAVPHSQNTPQCESPRKVSPEMQSFLAELDKRGIRHVQIA